MWSATLGLPSNSANVKEVSGNHFGPVDGIVRIKEGEEIKEVDNGAHQYIIAQILTN